ncbi:hypothetical protein PSN45_001747 [Yamadazyma tenuis]|uniref:Uncharacterized protein n=1 Tax=Candida tenuis (strain ATCC 10573 / BCRC 21748 / CBS 615 / JCM 9827 / NBRC 10315 / NRRL Y-1498 / VKM Y-70) TaxID=590646 RepID=G3BEA4_CANTC|nr:uncharacterized protein CANTEDRAFT_95943 [Yamadazyma tenuis ATCC 10573]EGV60502.1 hypothetical protein CANTEDRAFT_95943 [Yamadazyma tenuis ATCC 10573]WEJ94263.1 hypothetical protein PSN45_001747 [Yamadazyma tenuis]
MKSFIKSHKRNESLQSYTSSSTTKSPQASPLLNQSSSAPSSPKKLLNPIKNLFHKRQPSADLDDIFVSRPNFYKSRDVKVISEPLDIVRNSTKKSSKRLKSKSSASTNPDAPEEGDVDYADSSSEGSDDSNFSFVKDVIGGRNTSIKYYKTKSTQVPEHNRPIYFDNDQDHDIDVDDYDFENNGLDGYDGVDDYNDIEEDINYIDDFDDDVDKIDRPQPGSCISDDAVFNPEEYSNHFADTEDEGGYYGNMKIYSLHNKKPFNQSYHLSINGSKHGSDKSGDDHVDLLDSYLDVDPDEIGFTTDTPKFESIDDLQLYDLNSPLINGINMGGNTSSRFNNISPAVNTNLHPNVKSFHLSIDEIQLYKGEEDIGIGSKSETKNLAFGAVLADSALDDDEITNIESYNDYQFQDSSDELTKSPSDTQGYSEAQAEIDMTLKNLESSAEPKSDAPKSVPPRINRRSINELMNLLENLQVDNGITQQSKRDSIENMMHFLKNIQKTQVSSSTDGGILPNRHTVTSNAIKPVKETRAIKEQEDEDEGPNFLDTDLNDLEKDLLDEINQLPEDYDFDAREELLNQLDYINSSMRSSPFMRSSSFNKKPKKLSHSSSLKNPSKIETSNKTVTYYNKSQPGSFKSKSHSPIDDLMTIREKN